MCGIDLQSGTLNMTNGEILVDGYNVYGVYAYNEVQKVINITGGKIIIDGGRPVESFYEKNYGIYLSGQKFSIKSTLVIGTNDGEVNVESPLIDSTASLKLKDAVAYVEFDSGITYYYTLQEAINAIVNSDTDNVYLLTESEIQISPKSDN